MQILKYIFIKVEYSYQRFELSIKDPPPAVNKNVFTSQQNSELKAAQLFCILSKFSYKTYSHMKVTESLSVNENFARPRQHVVKGSLRLNLMFDGELVLNLSAKIYKNRAPADVAFSS